MNKRIYYAHTAHDENGIRLPESSGQWQPLSTHLLNVARIAKEFATPLGLGDEAELAGLMHDLGKYRDEFQSYLRGEREGGKETYHAIYGAYWAVAERKHALASVIAGHHAGLHDWSDLKGKVTKETVSTKSKSLKDKLSEACECGEIPEKLITQKKRSFCPDVYIRMLFSCLVDADRLDTAFWPDQPESDIPFDAAALLDRVKAERGRKQRASLNSTDTLSLLRDQIFDKCVTSGSKPPGFFSLTVPTGGGKTLSSMAFALAHAQAHNLRRVIVVIPYLSIIEQNAKEYRRILGDDVVLENHSSVTIREDANEGEKSRLELITENWDAPVVITTSVQFLESLFSSNPTSCRKLHRIANSVVIFDESQTIPLKLLQPIFSICRDLVDNYGVSFVFSSATQPAFLESEHLPNGIKTEELKLIITKEEQKDHYRELRRVNYHLPQKDERIDWPDLADRLAAEGQVLCVVNLTRHAARLWEELAARLPPDERPIHLSSNMCPQHRLELIEQIRWKGSDKPCRVISTQLIEAGVDVDFPVVWRAFGPLDSIVQVAGRCNREGKLARGNMHVFRPKDDNLPQGIYQAATCQAAITLAGLGNSASEKLATDPTIFGAYFESLYRSVDTDYKLPGETSIQEDREELEFRKIAEKARVIEDNSQQVIVFYGKGKALVDEIRSRGLTRFTRDDLRSLQRFMVNVRTKKLDVLKKLGQVEELFENCEIFVLQEASYHADLGLLIDTRPQEDFII